MTHQQQATFENTTGKGKIALIEQFLLFQQCFLLNQVIASPFVHIFEIISLFAAELEEPKIVISGKGLSTLLPEQDLKHLSFFYVSFSISASTTDAKLDINKCSVKTWTVIDYCKHTVNHRKGNWKNVTFPFRKNHSICMHLLI